MFKGWRFTVRDTKTGTNVYVSDFVFESKRHAGTEAKLFIEHYHPDTGYGWFAEEEQ